MMISPFFFVKWSFGSWWWQLTSRKQKCLMITKYKLLQPKRINDSKKCIMHAKAWCSHLALSHASSIIQGFVVSEEQWEHTYVRTKCSLYWVDSIDVWNVGNNQPTNHPPNKSLFLLNLLVQRVFCVGEGPESRLFRDLRCVPKAGRQREQVENQRRASTQVLFLCWSEDPNTTWLIPSTAEDPACWRQVSSGR